MLVYGDPEFRCTTSEAVALLRATLEQSEPRDLDSLRRLLIQLGQLEQSVADVLEEENHPFDPVLNEVQQVTDIAAELFCSAVSGCSAKYCIRNLENALSLIQLPDCHLTIKIQEGFEFYTLFPEQFLASTLQWCRQRKREMGEKGLVVGIRSIGTTLSAVVATTLRKQGHNVERISVRPQGHPFERTLAHPIRNEARFAIIVDEGPGISGSSMVAAAQALVRSGIDRGNIFFFPGSNKEPGPAASESVREWWNRTDRTFTSVDSCDWRGRDLETILLQKSAALTNKTFLKVEKLSGGLWRRLVCESYRNQLPSFAPFEREKFLCRAEDGSGLLWKFSGLGSLVANPSQTQSPERSSFVINTIASHHGFSAYPWVNGERMTRDQLTRPLLQHMASYLFVSARKPLPVNEHDSAIDRLVEMTYCNARNILGESAASASMASAEAARKCAHLPSYGDGRLGPWEWIRTRNGTIVKSDWSGHDADHTLVGRQSILWDVAGLAIEWDFSEAAEEQLIAIAANANIHIDFNALNFFKIAYSAFQMGKASLCESLASNADDRERLAAAKKFYCNSLSLNLKRHDSFKAQTRTIGLCDPTLSNAV